MVEANISDRTIVQQGAMLAKDGNMHAGYEYAGRGTHYVGGKMRYTLKLCNLLALRGSQPFFDFHETIVFANALAAHERT